MLAKRTWTGCRRLQRAHPESFGKLGTLDSWLRSLAITAAFLLIAYLLLS